MIGRGAIVDRVREWGLREDIVEKDYALGWVLWAIGSEPALSTSWLFRGGTCLKKCYIETYRFSEDLDFTVTAGGPLQPGELVPIFDTLLKRIGLESGIDFGVRPPYFRSRSPRSTEARIYYRGPRNAPTPGSIKLDLTDNEVVVQPSVLRGIGHPYEDILPDPAVVRCYGFEEVFAEKLRALGERLRPRDLYDVVNLFRRRDLRAEPRLIFAVLAEKCQWKGVAVPTYASLESSPYRIELESEWENMLAHQLPVLPPFEHFWEELPTLFAWLEGRLLLEELPVLAPTGEEDATWSAPPVVWTWGVGVPLETIRFAAANHLCVELRYGGTTRVIEPYSLRRTKEGNLVLHAVKADTREPRSYRVDRIQGIRVTTRAFRPVYAIEFAQVGPIVAPPTTRKVGTTTTGGSAIRRPKRPSSQPSYVIECPVCGKRFNRLRGSTALRPHKDTHGDQCFGKHGYIAEVRY